MKLWAIRIVAIPLVLIVCGPLVLDLVLADLRCRRVRPER